MTAEQINAETRERLNGLLRTCYPIGAESERDAIQRIGGELVRIIDALDASREPARTFGADQAERLAVDIRNAAGKHNDDALPVVHVVRKMAAVLNASPEPARAEPVTAVANALCQSGQFETGQGGCAPLCMSVLGASRGGPHGCPHALKVHGELARAVLAAAPPLPAVSLPEGWPWHATIRERIAGYLRDEADDDDRHDPECGIFAEPELADLKRWLARWLDQSPEQGGHG
jgi:hypothetical protein